MRMEAWVEEIEPGVLEAGYTLEPRATVTTTERVERFESKVAARQWVVDTAKLHGIERASICWEGSIPVRRGTS